MAFSDYCKQIDNNNVHILINNLPSHAFVDAIKVRDIYRVTILGRQSRKGVVEPGAGDVQILSILGKQNFITRKQLSSEFTHISGKKITLATLKNDKAYIVVRQCNEKYKAFKLPDNCVGTFNNKQVNKGSYVVAIETTDGNIDKDSIAIISASTFKKMFKIPMQHIIQKYMNKPNKSKEIKLFKKKKGMLNNFNSNSNLNSNSIKPLINLSEMGINPKNISIGNNAQNMNSNNDLNSRVSEDNNRYSYKVVGRLLSIQENKKLVGFNVQRLDTGEIKPCTIPQVTSFCDKRLVENLVLVRKENGTRYLKGNGIKLEQLPELLI